ncbi:MAG TPA: putative nucleotidyltransferase substrate binding domain-containing protein [Chloroflexota bacterium]|nr:putative nucleotidyltransferase substrate binding domain-containing protein [Chloroflexota bacterium]
MRNSGWYIPYWRRSKKKGKAEQATGGGEVQRSDEQMEVVRQRWVERYRRILRSLRLMGLSMGSTRAEVRERYERLREEGTVPARELEDAYRFLMRVMLAQERRKRRARRGENSDQPVVGAAEETTTATVAGEDADETSDEDDGDEVDDDEDQDEETGDPGIEAGLLEDDTPGEGRLQGFEP